MSRRSARRMTTPREVQRLAGRRRGADRVDVLLPEAEPEPGVDEGRVGGRHDGVVARRALVDPARGREPVQVADDLGLRRLACPAPSTHMFGPHLASRGAPTR